ncbi:hypothetical protein QOZ80_3BG0253220 [Eleusine coracana subsp. coracana]|nr:hypothetical protein QOZ80_3BG0253220 [Eleusine coracana subsp. coracana]
MPPPSCGNKPRPGGEFSGKRLLGLSAVASNKPIARPASASNLTAAAASRPSSKLASAAATSRAPPHQPATPKQQQSAGNKMTRPGESSSELFMAPRDAKMVHPARRLAPGTAVCVRTRFKMITEKCCLVIWLPARVVSASGAYHCTVKYSADLSPAFAGKMVRKPVDHIRVVKAEPRNMVPPADVVTQRVKAPKRHGAGAGAGEER